MFYRYTLEGHFFRGIIKQLTTKQNKYVRYERVRKRFKVVIIEVRNSIEYEVTCIDKFLVHFQIFFLRTSTRHMKRLDSSCVQ